MEDFINRIIEIDKQARKMTVDTDALKAKADEEIAKINEAVKAKYDQKTEKAVSEYREQSEKQSEQKLADKKAYYEKISEDFGKVYEQNKDRWVDELVKRSIG